jgi:hypothetical protein
MRTFYETSLPELELEADISGPYAEKLVTQIGLILPPKSQTECLPPAGFYYLCPEAFFERDIDETENSNNAQTLTAIWRPQMFRPLLIDSLYASIQNLFRILI